MLARCTRCIYFGGVRLHESLPLYSGGLGILAGDHVKSASDLGVPVVGVGLFYARGYFRQGTHESGWQNEEYGTNDIATFPLMRAAAPDGSPLTIAAECVPDRLHALVWLAHVGPACCSWIRMSRRILCHCVS